MSSYELVSYEPEHRVDYLTLHWLETRSLSKERMRELMVDLFVSVVTAAATVAARKQGKGKAA